MPGGKAGNGVGVLSEAGGWVGFTGESKLQDTERIVNTNNAVREYVIPIFCMCASWGDYTINERTAKKVSGLNKLNSYDGIHSVQ